MLRQSSSKYKVVHSNKLQKYKVVHSNSAGKHAQRCDGAVHK